MSNFAIVLNYILGIIFFNSAIFFIVNVHIVKDAGIHSCTDQIQVWLDLHQIISSSFY